MIIVKLLLLQLRFFVCLFLVKFLKKSCPTKSNSDIVQCVVQSVVCSRSQSLTNFLSEHIPVMYSLRKLKFVPHHFL